MFIKEFAKSKLTDSNHYTIYYYKIGNMYYIATFFYDAFPYIYRSGTINFIQKLKTRKEVGMSSEMITLDIDYENNLAYISEHFYWSKKEITPEIEQLIEEEKTIELCHRNFVGYAVMTQENLFHLFMTWTKFRDNQVPYILMYLDDNNWYDSISFETEAAMDQFVADHTTQG